MILEATDATGTKCVPGSSSAWNNSFLTPDWAKTSVSDGDEPEPDENLLLEPDEPEEDEDQREVSAISTGGASMVSTGALSGVTTPLGTGPTYPAGRKRKKKKRANRGG